MADFEMDRDFIDAWGKHLFRFLSDFYWRIETRGLSNVPGRGRAMLVGIHRGFVPFDAIMIVHLLASRRQRYPRFLVHPGLLKPPLIRSFIRKMGGVLATQENAGRVLENESILGVFPEGVRAAFSRYSDLYRLRRYRHRFIRIAIRHRAPILPFVATGPGEVLPVIAQIRWRWWEKKTLWPCLPIPASPVPLPTKWRLRFLPPLDVSSNFTPEQADDARVVGALGKTVRRRLIEGLKEVVLRR